MLGYDAVDTAKTFGEIYVAKLLEFELDPLCEKAKTLDYEELRKGNPEQLKKATAVFASGSNLKLFEDCLDIYEKTHNSRRRFIADIFKCSVGFGGAFLAASYAGKSEYTEEAPSTEDYLLATAGAAVGGAVVAANYRLMDTEPRPKLPENTHASEFAAQMVSIEKSVESFAMGLAKNPREAVSLGFPSLKQGAFREASFAAR